MRFFKQWHVGKPSVLSITNVFSLQGSTVGSHDGLGRVTYEHNGEWFFLPYGLDDIVDNTGSTQIKPGDQVTFFIATDKR